MKKGEILDRVYKSNIPSRAKQIMFYLINRANAEGTCFPSVKTIASDCGVSERTVQRTMKVLLESGFVIKENRYRDNGGQSSNLYKLQIKPENDDIKPDTNNEKIAEKKIGVEEVKEKKNNTESIETVTFDNYIEAKKTEAKNLNVESKSVFCNVFQKPLQNTSFVIEFKCHQMLFYNKDNTAGTILPSNSLCHGVGVNLYPP